MRLGGSVLAKACLSLHTQQVFSGPPSKKPYRKLSTSPFAAPVEAPIDHFEVGDRVHHDTHGLGRVTSVEENPGAVTVDFGTSRERLVSPYSKLSHL
jgi:hypothetical protein